MMTGCLPVLYVLRSLKVVLNEFESDVIAALYQICLIAKDQGNDEGQNRTI